MRCAQKSLSVILRVARLRRHKRFLAGVMPLSPVSPRIRTPSHRVVCWLLLVGLAAIAARGAEAEARRRFDVPAGPAVVTLKRVVQQAELEIVYSATLVEGVQTDAIAGEFTPQDALDRMLANSPLKIFQDPQTKVLSVMRRPGAEPRAPPNPAPAQESSQTMKRKNPIATLGAWLALAIGGTSATHAAENAPSASTSSATISGRIQNVASGQYLNNARVSVRGTELVAFSDQTGTYRLPQVPTGSVVLDVFYTGLDAQTATIEVAAGQAATRDFDLTSASRYGDGGVVKLDSFTVSTSRETDGAAIAINEQRFAPNIKNVVAADSLGDVMDGNIGEFLKFVPGITPEYDYEDGTTVSTVSIRGFAPHMVAISTDGAQMANTSNAMGDSRAFSFNQASINNISRIEVAKVPTPSNRADSLSGSVNMVSKSAFERKQMQFRYNLNLAANSENFNLRKTPHTTDEKIYKLRPGGNFDLTLPINSRFGIVMTGAATERYAKLHYSYKTYNSAGTSTGASVTAPFLSTYRLLDSPRTLVRQSIGLKADWQVTRHGVLTVGGQVSHFQSTRIATEFTSSVGTNGVPTPATGIPFSYGPDFAIGATGRGSVTLGGATSTHIVTDATAGNIRYRYDNGTWKVMLAADKSRAQGGYRDQSEGHFRQMAIGLRNPARLEYRNINDVRPESLKIFDNNNREVDLYDINNYQLNTVNSTPRRTREDFESGSVDIGRMLGFLSFPASVQLGAQQRTQTRDIRRRNENWTYNGINGDRSPAPFVSPVYKGQYHYYGFNNLPHLSPILAYQAYQSNPSLFTKTAAQLVTEETFRINNSQLFEESVGAYYAQTEFSLFKYRLKVLTGMRYEKTETEGLGALVDSAAVWQRNPDGSFVRNAAGQRVRRADAGAAGSMEQLRLTHKERQYRADRTYDGYYPSLHLNYNFADNLIGRAAWAKTYGRPNLNNIIPTATVDEADLEGNELGNPAIVQGNITVTNTGLKPWSADNYDLSLEYYTKGGGLFSAGVFLKDIKNFFSNIVRVATPADVDLLGLDPRYVGWRVSTQINGGSARVYGAEFNVRQSLRELGSWGRNVAVFINGTKLELEGESEAAFTAFTPESLNWGFSYSRRPATFMAKWNYRGKRRLGAQPQLAPDAFEYDDRRLTLDLNLDVEIKKWLQFYVAAQNVFNTRAVTMRYGSATPDYAKIYLTGANGVGLTMGIKGSF
jgi:iron complex outermembrane receptor protein